MCGARRGTADAGAREQPALQPVVGQRPADQEALQLVAAHLGQQFARQLVLDALGDDPQAEVVRQLPIDEVKIDKSFVLGMSTSQGESFIARSIIELAHNLGLRVVAEGVEDELTRKLLAEMGCDKLQGFLVSRPLPDDRLESWLLARTGVRSAAPGATHRRLFVRT